MNYLDTETWIYIGIIIAFLIFFLWNRKNSKQRKKNKKDFRQSYYEKKKEQ